MMRSSTTGVKKSIHLIQYRNRNIVNNSIHNNILYHKNQNQNQNQMVSYCTKLQFIPSTSLCLVSPFSTASTSTSTSTTKTNGNNITNGTKDIKKITPNDNQNHNDEYSQTTTAATTATINTNNNDRDDRDDMNIDETNERSTLFSNRKRIAKRVWSSQPIRTDDDGDDSSDHSSSSSASASTNTNTSTISNNTNKYKSLKGFWHRSVDDTDLSSMQDVVNRISVQEQQGGRMRQRKLGVLTEDPKEDMRLLIENYTVPALASALRDREDVLQQCASLLAENKLDDLREILRPFESQFVDKRRQQEINLNLLNGFDTSNLEMLRKGLNRMPRRVSQAHQHRAGVVLPLCNVDGVPCILFEKRSTHLRAHPDEVCLPGGMVSSANDRSIVATCLREMSEEIEGIDENDNNISVLGVLRCNWGEVHHLVGVAVTPVVCFIGDITSADLRPNPDEVAECFTVPLDLFLDNERWVHRQDYAPMFTGGPYAIWGLTGYIVNRFVKDVLARYRVQMPPSYEPFHRKFRP